MALCAILSVEHLNLSFCLVKSGESTEAFLGVCLLYKLICIDFRC